MKTAVVWSCAHADPDVNNDRFDWLGKFIYDLRPDYCIDLGDGADMRSLNTYDTRYPQAIVSQSYEKDIDVYNDSQERIRHQFKKNKKKMPTWIGFEGNHCVPKDTDVLTKRGWLNIEEVTTEDSVMSLEGWTSVEETHKVFYSGPLYKFGDRSSVAYVTENHRVYYYNGSGNLVVKLAKDCPESLDLPVSTITEGDVDLTDAQIAFNAVAMTDSYHTKQGGLVFYQSGEKANRIESIIQSVGIPYRKTERSRVATHICGKELKSVQVGYEFHMKEKPSWVVEDNKSIPDWVFDLSERQFEVLLDVLIFCDGSIPTKATSSLVFYGQQKICEDLQAVLNTKGYRATITEYREGQFRVNICKAFKCRAKKQVVEESYDNWVFCLTTGSGNFLMRQNYKPVFTGNCNRIKKAISTDPRLEGQTYGISFKHLQTDYWFDEYHEYENSAPSVAHYDGVAYSHYFASGNSGRAISGVHHAYSLCQSINSSATCGHSHFYSYYYKDSIVRPLIGHVVGCFKGKEESWAGQSNSRWRHGVVVKRNLDNGIYDHEWVSMDALRREYS